MKIFSSSFYAPFIRQCYTARRHGSPEQPGARGVEGGRFVGTRGTAGRRRGRAAAGSELDEGTSRMHILLVEDETKVASFVARSLQAEGHTVEMAGEGEDARAALTAASFDLVVLDLMLPGVDGITLCRELRARGDTTPILMLTARDTVQDRVHGLDSGADDYLTKPFALEELLARVRALLRRPRQAQPTQLRLADLTVDTYFHRAWRGEREVLLSAKEYALLAYLMANPDRVLSRPMIEEAVWGFDFNCATNVVDVYIGLLRRKLEAGGEPRLIHTVRSMGYVLRVSACAGPDE
jgi:DNA-binding response OmpR family regulator